MYLYSTLCKRSEARMIRKLIHADVNFAECHRDEIHVYHMRCADGHVVADSSGTIEVRVRLVAVFGSVNSEHGCFCPVCRQYASICE